MTARSRPRPKRKDDTMTHTIDLAQVAVCVEADAALIGVLLGPDKTEAVDLVLHRIEHMMLVLRAIGEVPVPVVESAGE